jgi:hypothetical protein
MLVAAINNLNGRHGERMRLDTRPNAVLPVLMMRDEGCDIPKVETLISAQC